MMEQILNFFVSNAHADAMGPLPGASPQGGGISFAVMFVGLFVFMYFFILRPQNKRAKEAKTMLDALAKGDEVMTAGGLLGRITKINDPYVGLMIANNVEIMLQKSSVVNVMPKGTLKSIE